jgi:hypothetical protein
MAWPCDADRDSRRSDGDRGPRVRPVAGHGTSDTSRRPGRAAGHGSSCTGNESDQAPKRGSTSRPGGNCRTGSSRKRVAGGRSGTICTGGVVAKVGWLAADGTWDTPWASSVGGSYGSSSKSCARQLAKRPRRLRCPRGTVRSGPRRLAGGRSDRRCRPDACRRPAVCRDGSRRTR